MKKRLKIMVFATMLLAMLGMFFTVDAKEADAAHYFGASFSGKTLSLTAPSGSRFIFARVTCTEVKAYDKNGGLVYEADGLLGQARVENNLFGIETVKLNLEIPNLSVYKEGFVVVTVNVDAEAWKKPWYWFLVTEHVATFSNEYTLTIPIE